MHLKVLTENKVALRKSLAQCILETLQAVLQSLRFHKSYHLFVLTWQLFSFFLWHVFTFLTVMKSRGWILSVPKYAEVYSRKLICWCSLHEALNLQTICASLHIKGNNQTPTDYSICLSPTSGSSFHKLCRVRNWKMTWLEGGGQMTQFWSDFPPLGAQKLPQNKHRLQLYLAQFKLNQSSPGS